ncbi:MAG: hypothetical protein ACR2OB_04105 [Solirubrobacteraceae bacterium]
MIEIAALAVAAMLLACLGFMAHPRTRTAMKDSARLLAALARDRRIPRPLRWLLVVALLPIPGPFEEIAGGLAVGVIAWRYRAILAEHRGRSAR